MQLGGGYLGAGVHLFLGLLREHAHLNERQSYDRLLAFYFLVVLWKEVFARYLLGRKKSTGRNGPREWRFLWKKEVKFPELESDVHVTNLVRFVQQVLWIQ